MFEESPSESRHAAVSPVFCVDNPITATSVPVDSDTNISWVCMITFKFAGYEL